MTKHLKVFRRSGVYEFRVMCGKKVVKDFNAHQIYLGDNNRKWELREFLADTMEMAETSKFFDNFTKAKEYVIKVYVDGK